MRTLYMMRGLPASGKTTVAKKMVDDQGVKRVNRDELRMMIDNGRYSEEREYLIKEVRDSVITKSLWLGYDVVIDDTNLKSEDEDHFRRLIAATDVNFQVVNMHTPLEECLERDRNRENSVRVGEKVIRELYEKYLLRNKE